MLAGIYLLCLRMLHTLVVTLAKQKLVKFKDCMSKAITDGHKESDELVKLGLLSQKTNNRGKSVHCIFRSPCASMIAISVCITILC